MRMRSSPGPAPPAQAPSALVQRRALHHFIRLQAMPYIQAAAQLFSTHVRPAFASALPDALIASSLQLLTPAPHLAVAAATRASHVESAVHSIASVQQFCFWHVMHAVSADAAAHADEAPALPLVAEPLVPVAEPVAPDVAVEPVHAVSHCESAHVLSALNAALSLRHVSQVPFCTHVDAHVEQAASFLQALASEQHF